MKSFPILFLILLFAKIAFAIEPPRETIIKALSKGKTAFIGKPRKIEIVNEKSHNVTAKMELQILYCFSGLDCKKDEVLSLQFQFQNSKETSLPVEFPLGAEIVFVMNQPFKDLKEFDSDWQDGIDRAFICDTFPQSILTLKERFPCKSIYGGKPESWIKFDELLIKGDHQSP